MHMMALMASGAWCTPRVRASTLSTSQPAAHALSNFLGRNTKKMSPPTVDLLQQTVESKVAEG
eukprot:m.168023 g.168023  ORF g.168023 m.168023 type:complete len:63 (-) comp53187_c1_seq18:284-472(-)